MQKESILKRHAPLTDYFTMGEKGIEHFQNGCGVEFKKEAHDLRGAHVATRFIILLETTGKVKEEENTGIPLEISNNVID